MSTVDRLIDRWRPTPTAVATAAVVLLVEATVVLGYVAVTRPIVTSPLLVVAVPAVWVNLSLWVFLRVRPAATDARRWPAVLVAVGYFGLLAVLGGLVNAGGATGGSARVTLAGFPGWVPLVIVDGALADVVLVPFKAVGYIALAYLVYVTAVDAAGAVVGGALGLLSCVSCTFPLIAGLVAALTGGGGAVASAVYSNSYLLSTVVFAVTVALLAWRPTAGSLARLRTAVSR